MAHEMQAQEKGYRQPGRERRSGLQCKETGRIGAQSGWVEQPTGGSRTTGHLDGCNGVQKEAGQLMALSLGPW